MRRANLTIILISVLALWGCKEEVDVSNRYVFRDHTVYSYLQNHEQFSEFAEILSHVKVSHRSTSTLSQLLLARGHYTVFAPTNQAIHEYLEVLVTQGLIDHPGWDAFLSEHKLDSIRKVIAYNAIIDGRDERVFYTSDFSGTNAELPLSNLSDRKLTTRYGQKVDELYVNYDCPVDELNRDIMVINGVVHCVNKVIWMKDLSMSQLMTDILDEKQHGFQVAARLILTCGLKDTLSKFRDEVYEEKYQRGELPDFDAKIIGWVFHGASGHQTAYMPEHRKYGFTVFAETDDFWERELGKPATDITPAEIQQWVIDNRQYSISDDFDANAPFDSPNSLLYQWVTYHILPFKTPANRLVFHNNEKGYSLSIGQPTIPVMEYYTTMGKRRMIKLFESRESTGVYINRFPNLDKGRRGTYHELSCDEDKRGALIDNRSDDVLSYDVLNGIIYAIDQPIAYTDEVRTNLSRERIRYDAMSLFPEAMSNDIRKKASTDYRNQFVHIPPTSVYPYFENMEMNDETHFVYLNSYGYDWCNNQADELKAEGRYDITVKLPPVPRSGTYELRYRILANIDRGVVQFYFGHNHDNLVPCGIPVDLTVLGSNPITGWDDDTDDDDYNAEIDKRMRNFGAMKGEEAIVNSFGSARSRSNSQILRRIIVRQFVDANKTYYLRMKSVLDSDTKEFYMDHLEWCAKEVFDNPMEPEDIW